MTSWETTLTLNIYMIITIYMACNAFICKILFGLIESFKITLFKDLLGKIMKAKVGKIAFLTLFS